MAIKGYQGTSLLDYPGHIASLVFYGGCNLTCPFCHNPDLVLVPDDLPDFPRADIFEDLQARKNFIDGIVVTGGEPTSDPELLEFLRKIKELGLLVKLDTNGLAPRVLAEALSERLVDYLALDLKTSPERYGELHTRPVGLASLRRTIELVCNWAGEYEMRTTCVPGFVTERDIRRIGEEIRGARRWVLQQYVPGHALRESCRSLTPYSPVEVERLARLAEGFVETVVLRGL